MGDSFTSGRVITFGCRLNASESEIIEKFLKELNLTNHVIINTCAVTAEAERKLRQTIRKLHGSNPKVKIILTGCASEINRDFYIKMDGVAGIIPNSMKFSKSEYLKYTDKQDVPENKIIDNCSADNKNNEKQYAATNKKIRSFLQIQNGCDQKCTYCVVWMARGRSISFGKDEIVLQAKNLLNSGYKEIVLTGVNISAYGRDQDPPKNLSHIIRYLLKNVPELKRLRLSSVDPADIDDDLIKLFGNEEKLLPHLHESIQSGDNLILKQMGRRHSREQVIDINEKIMQVRPDLVFGADIIVGFPTETDEMFQHTVSLIREANISLLHHFPFSPRPGAAAAAMPRVSKKTITVRVSELKDFSEQILHKKLSEYIGKETVVLAEKTKIAKTNSFLQVQSNEPLEVGKEYIFYCESCDKKYIIGNPVMAIS